MNYSNLTPRDGRIAIVTGGARGIGLETAKAFKDNGATVVTVDINRETGMKAAEELGIDFIQADLTQSGQVKELATEVCSKHGRIDIAFNNAGIAVSLDMDFVDPSDAPGVGTPVRGGVTYREAHLAMEMIADSEAMVSMEIVEINPVIDEHNRTALLAVELALSGLGKKIL